MSWKRALVVNWPGIMLLAVLAGVFLPMLLTPERLLAELEREKEYVRDHPYALVEPAFSPKVAAILIALMLAEFGIIYLIHELKRRS